MNNQKVAKAAARLVRFMKKHGANELELFSDGSYSLLTDSYPPKSVPSPKAFPVYLDRVEDLGNE